MKKFEEVLNEWLVYMEMQVKPSTYACYVRLTTGHIIPFFMGKTMDEVNQGLISAFITEKLGHGRIDGRGGLSEKTVKDMMSIINSVCKYGEIIYGIKRPALFKWRYNNITKPTQTFSAAEQRILEKYLLSDLTAKKLGIFICLYSGMRLGEICALRWSDIDTNLKVFHVRRTVQRIYMKGQEQASKIIIDTPKTQAAIRDIPIPSHLWKILCKKKKQFGKNFCVISDQDKVFLDPRTYQINYKKYLTQCGLPYRNFHALRHTFATRCIEKEIDVKSLSEILGHSSVTITLNCYVHSSLEQKRSQLEKLYL